MQQFQIGDRVYDNGGYPLSNGNGRIGTVVETQGSTLMVDFQNGTLWYYVEEELLKVGEGEAEDMEEEKTKYNIGDLVWFIRGYCYEKPVAKVVSIEKDWCGTTKYRLDGQIYSFPEEMLYPLDENETSDIQVGEYGILADGFSCIPQMVHKVDGPFIFTQTEGWQHYARYTKYEPCEAVRKWGNFYYTSSNAHEGLCSLLPQATSTLCYDPQIKVDGDKLKVSLYQNREDYDRGRRTLLKVGRAVRMLYPRFSDKEVQYWVDEINKKFTPREYTLRTSTTAEDFVHVYTYKQSPYENPRTTSGRKCLADSCMRYDFVGDEGFPNHPVEAYASGDFMIIWTEDADGRIGSRSVVSIHGEKWVAGPVYGVCEKSLNMIEEYVTDNGGYLFKDDRDWNGARVCKLPDTNGRYIGPYFDSGEFLREEDKFFIVDQGGSIGTSDHQGYLEYDDRVTCDSCEDRVYEDYVRHSESGGCYCEDCYYERFSYCEEDHCEIDADDAVCVKFTSPFGYAYMTVHSDYAVKCERTDEWWHVKDTVEDFDGEPVSPQYAEEHMILCQHSDKWCDPEDTVIVLIDNEEQSWHKDLVVMNDDYKYNKEDGLYHPVEKLEQA